MARKCKAKEKRKSTRPLFKKVQDRDMPQILPPTLEAAPRVTKPIVEL